MSRLIRIFTVCFVSLFFISIIKILNKQARCPNLVDCPNLPYVSRINFDSVITHKAEFLIILFDSLRPINNLSVKQGRVFLGWTSNKLGLMCLAQGHNTVMPVSAKPAAPRSRVKHSTTEPLRSLIPY